MDKKSAYACNRAYNVLTRYTKLLCIVKSDDIGQGAHNEIQ